MFVLAPVIVPLVFGAPWSEAVPVVQLLALASCLNGLLQTVPRRLRAAGQPARSLLRSRLADVAGAALYVTAQISIRRRGLRHVLGMLVFGGVKLVLARSTLASRPSAGSRGAAPGLLATGAMVLVLVAIVRLAAPLPPLVVVALAMVLGMATYGVALRMLDPRAIPQMLDLLIPEHRRTTRRTHPPASSQRLAVTMFVQSYFPRVGGAETNLQSLINHSAAAGVDVTVLTRRIPEWRRMTSCHALPCSVCLRRMQWRASFTFTPWQQCGCWLRATPGERWTSCMRPRSFVLNLDRVWPSSYCDGSHRACRAWRADLGANIPVAQGQCPMEVRACACSKHLVTPLSP